MKDTVTMLVEALEAIELALKMRIPASEILAEKSPIREGVQAALSAAKGGGWMPIESAPKDGSLLMLFERYEDEPFFGRWNEFKGRWVASTAHYDTDGDACVIDSVYSEGVTAWQPLPPPPKD